MDIRLKDLLEDSKTKDFLESLSKKKKRGE